MFKSGQNCQNTVCVRFGRIVVKLFYCNVPTSASNCLPAPYGKLSHTHTHTNTQKNCTFTTILTSVNVGGICIYDCKTSVFIFANKFVFIIANKFVFMIANKSVFIFANKSRTKMLAPAPPLKCR